MYNILVVDIGGLQARVKVALYEHIYLHNYYFILVVIGNYRNIIGNDDNHLNLTTLQMTMTIFCMNDQLESTQN